MKKKLQRDAKTITNNAQCSKRVKAADKYKTMTNSCSISSCVVSLSVSGVGGLEPGAGDQTRSSLGSFRVSMCETVAKQRFKLHHFSAKGCCCPPPTLTITPRICICLCSCNRASCPPPPLLHSHWPNQ